MMYGVDKVEHRQKTDAEKIVDILGYFWSLNEEDQKQILKILNDDHKSKEGELWNPGL